MDDKRKRLDQLIAQRDILELESSIVADELRSPGSNGERPAGIKDSLVDEDGFPRSDIDIYLVKANRQRLAVINTDHKEVMKQIESLLPEILIEKSEEPRQLKENGDKIPSTEAFPPTRGPIGLIDQIADKSPAMLAGLQNGDLLLAFGTITAESSGNVLSLIPNVVQMSINQPLPLIIRRQGVAMNISIIPRAWGGKGLLGMHLSPI